MMYKLAMSRVSDLLASFGKVIAPIERAEQVNFGAWSPEETLRLDVLKTVNSAKDAFFPQSEDIVHFKMEGKNIAIGMPEKPDEPFVLFGARACDVRALDVLDRVFLSEPADPGYAARRKNGTIVSIACARPAETCFCHAYGIDATAPQGDVACWIDGDTLYWQPQSEKGQALTETAKPFLEECPDTAADAAKQAIREILNRLPLKDLTLDGWGGDVLMEKFNSEKWADLSRACLGCGACTFVCPTCQCYDIRDFDTGHGIQRYRCWDSCMYKDFTMMAHGTPRPTQLERYRQRFMHKLVYFPANNDGMFSCVGCGRCVAKCPVSSHIVKVIKALGGDAK